MFYRVDTPIGIRPEHLAALMAALRHPEGLVSPPMDLPVHAHGRLLRNLVGSGHAELVQGVSYREEDVWESSEGPCLLRITELGVEAARHAATEAAEPSEQDAPPVSVGTSGDTASIPVSEAYDEMSSGMIAELVEETSLVDTSSDGASSSPVSSPSFTGPRRFGIGAKVLDLLRQDEGVSIAELVAATGWQPHTVRGYLSQLRRKGLRIEASVSSFGPGGKRGKVYRVAAWMIVPSAEGHGG